MELSVGDLDPSTQFEWCADPTMPDLALSEAFLCPGVVLFPGETTAALQLDTVANGIAEGPEVVVLEVFAGWGPLGAVTGTVDDAEVHGISPSQAGGLGYLGRRSADR